MSRVLSDVRCVVVAMNLGDVIYVTIAEPSTGTRHQAHTTGRANYFMEEFYLENGHLGGKTLTSNHFV